MLYVTRNGLLEPLGQSQVFGYLRGLSRDCRFTLITYEKPEDWADIARVARARAECAALGINWLPQRFAARPKLVAPALSLLRMAWLLRREALRNDVRLIHARSYIPAGAALLVSRWTGIPFIFDMRALWPEELITAGRLRRGSALHRAIAGVERSALREAGGVVSLTQAAADYLRAQFPKELAGQRLAVIPTCADLDRFVPAKARPQELVIGCLGTLLSGWFKIDWLAAFITAAAQADASVRFVLTTRDDAEQVRAALHLPPELWTRVSIAPSSSDKVQQVLQGQVASAMFYAGGAISEIGRSPTRMGEILGCGLPVVANDGVGDVARIIRTHQVGVIARSESPADMAAAWQELMALRADPQLAGRCRRAAEEVFSLSAGTAAYRTLYKAILNNTPLQDEPLPCAA